MTSDGPSRVTARLRAPEPAWQEPGTPDPDLVADLERSLRLPRTVCAILVVRGHGPTDAAKQFLRPGLDQLHDPRLLADGVVAAERISHAIREGETIFVHGDYDVDGICATAVLTRWLRFLGGDVVPFVPHRVRDGYDFSANGLAAALQAKADLIITVDCGTVAHETVAAAKAAGLDVIVTDHHTVGDRLPDALAVVNPQRADCGYPEKGLCGAGLAYRLAELVGAELNADLDALTRLLDLVALATVADLVPLGGENRVLVHHGLRRFPQTTVEGVRRLLHVADVDPAKVTAGRIGYQIAPRINAAGRLGDSADALRLLLTENPGEAAGLATQLDAMNAKRRDEDQRTLDEALSDLEERFDPQRDFGIVVAARGWHPGVIGIVASRVVERIHRPVVMVALGEDGGRGSARSIPGFHLYEALAECSEHLERFGGHRQAAGMDIREENLEAFALAFNDAARSRLAGEDLRPSLRPDIDVDLGEVDVQLVHWLGYLGPHGMGNPGPVFRTRGVVLEAPRVVGERHLKLTLRAGPARLDAIGFGLAERFPTHTLEGSWDALFRLERNEWRGRVSAQAKLLDLRRAE